MMQSQILMAAQEPSYVAGEPAYRREHVRRLHRNRPGRRRWVPRRPHLSLPRRHRRPLVVA